MVDANGIKTVKVFDVLSTNGGKEAPYTPVKKYTSVNPRK